MDTCNGIYTCEQNCKICEIKINNSFWYLLNCFWVFGSVSNTRHVFPLIEWVLSIGGLLAQLLKSHLLYICIFIQQLACNFRIIVLFLLTFSGFLLLPSSILYLSLSLTLIKTDHFHHQMTLPLFFCSLLFPWYLTSTMICFYFPRSAAMSRYIFISGDFELGASHKKRIRTICLSGYGLLYSIWSLLAAYINLQI